jgi:Methionyl-tRNA formyltransferase
MGLRVVFFGTPDFAVPSLRALSASPHEVITVVTNPDRPVGSSRVDLQACKLEYSIVSPK